MAAAKKSAAKKAAAKKAARRERQAGVVADGVSDTTQGDDVADGVREARTAKNDDDDVDSVDDGVSDTQGDEE